MAERLQSVNAAPQHDAGEWAARIAILPRCADGCQFR
jgi:hypothetical protein